jgi:hypothetical protein
MQLQVSTIIATLLYAFSGAKCSPMTLLQLNWRLLAALLRKRATELLRSPAWVCLLYV